jgi:hypothetical protein
VLVRFKAFGLGVKHAKLSLFAQFRARLLVSAFYHFNKKHGTVYSRTLIINYAKALKTAQSIGEKGV